MAILVRLTLLAVLALLGGCYTLRPAAIESLPAGATVRARLTPAGTENVSALTGRESPRLEGRFVRANPDTVLLDVWRTDLRLGRDFAPGRLPVSLPRRDVVEVAEKRLSLVRTGAVAAVLGVGAYQIYRLLASGAGGTSTGTPGAGGPSIIRIGCC